MSNSTFSGETRVNTSVSDDQLRSSITTLSDGGWVVTWMSNGTDGDGYGIYQQRYTASGLPAGGEIRVNATEDNDQTLPSVTALANGGWVVTWQSREDDGNGWDIYQQRFNSRGLQAGHETRVNTFTAGEQSDAAVKAFADGSWVVTWTSHGQDGAGAGIYQQRYGSSGSPIGNETLVNTTTSGFQQHSSVTDLAYGGWVVTWTSENTDRSGLGICQQRYDANGNPVGEEITVNTFTSGHQRDPSVTALSAGGWVVTWMSDGQDGSASGIYQKRYDVTGNPMGHEVRVNTTTVNSQIAAETITLADGGWLVVWASYDQDGDMYGIYQQRYDASGQTVGGETRVNTATSDQQYMPSLSALADGGWVVTWTSSDQDGSGEGIYQQRFNKDGQKIGPTTPTGLDLSALKANEGGHFTIDVGDLSVGALVKDGGFTYTLLDDAGGRFKLDGNKLKLKDHVKLDYEQAQSHTVKILVKDPLGATFEKSFAIAVTDIDSENLVGSAASDTIKGGQYADVFYGDGGDDVLWGGGGLDRICGGLGNDLLQGGTGKDTFVFDTKADKFMNVDRIEDFNVRDDSIWLDNAVFTKLGSGSASKPKKFKADMFAKGTKAQDAEDRIIYDKKTGALYYDQDGTGSKAQVKIATLSKNLKMTAGDFFVI